MVHTIENACMSIKVKNMGAELTSIYDKEKNQEVLWQGNPKFWNRQAPILFPNVGKYNENRFHYNGKEYKQGQHGFARDMEFTCINQTENEMVFRLKANENTVKSYPFLFELNIKYRLEERNLHVEWNVKNEGNNTMYFTIGGHPAFNVPILEGTKQTDYQLFFGDKEELRYLLLDPSTGTAIASRIHRLKLENGSCKIQEDMFNKDALIFDNQQIERVAITYPNGQPYIEMHCKGFPNFGIWSKPGAPYLCLEPWFGRCDNKGFHHDISEKNGIIYLEPTEMFTVGYDIIVH